MADIDALSDLLKSGDELIIVCHTQFEVEAHDVTRGRDLTR
jgi:hypothetical protein